MLATPSATRARLPSPASGRDSPVTRASSPRIVTSAPQRNERARAFNPGGTYPTVGGVTARVLQVAIVGWWIRRTTRRKGVLINLKQNKSLAYLSERFEAGQLAPVIDGPYRLSDARDAFRHFAAANHQGKVVIVMEGR